MFTGVIIRTVEEESRLRAGEKQTIWLCRATEDGGNYSLGKDDFAEIKKGDNYKITEKAMMEAMLLKIGAGEQFKLVCNGAVKSKSTGFRYTDIQLYLQNIPSEND
jgi:hypothetical protein